MGKFKHGLTGTPIETSYNSAEQRCNNPKNKDYKNYGGRGIKWMFEGILGLYNELGQRPSELTLDRIDNNGNYEAGNVRWATRKEQNANQRKIQARKVRPEDVLEIKWLLNIGYGSTEIGRDYGISKNLVNYYKNT